jgi:hypothetical protein
MSRKDGIRQAFTDLIGNIPQAAWDIKSVVYEGDHMLLHWAAESEKIQTVNATYTPKG